MKVGFIAVLMLAGCATTNQQVQDTFDDCIAHGGTEDRCHDKAEARRAELDGTPVRSEGVHAPSEAPATPSASDADALPPECRSIAGLHGTANDEARKQWDACELAKDRLQRKKAEDQRRKDRRNRGKGSARCEADSDCKGDRVCEDGRCVPPGK